jgi:carboxymethylenebutenolidase
MPSTQPDGYLAIPATGKGSPVLLLHAWWGLNETIKTLCTRLAEAGFVTFAPDLYHGKVADTIAGAEALGKALDARHEQAMAEVREAAKFLQQRSGMSELAVIGFSLGAFYAVKLAATDPAIRSVVLFYGSGEGDFSDSQAAFLGHFAELDEYEPSEYITGLEQSLRAAGRPVTFYQYPGVGHWFFEADRTQAFNQEAADLAWERTLAFLRRSPL